MTFSVGDRVKFLDFGESGTVVAVLDDASLVIDVDGIDMRVSVKEIVRVGKESCADEVRLYDGNSQVSRFTCECCKEREKGSPCRIGYGGGPAYRLYPSELSCSEKYS